MKLLFRLRHPAVIMGLLFLVFGVILVRKMSTLTVQMVPSRTSTSVIVVSNHNNTVGKSYNKQSLHFEKFNITHLVAIEDRKWIRTDLPQFFFKPPQFADNRSEYLFYKHVENTQVLRVQPMPKFTEILFLRNGTYVSDKHCGYKGASDWINQTRNSQRTSAKYWYPVLAPVLSIDGWSLQHFIDGTIHLLIQILPLVQHRSVKILTYWPRDKILFDLFDKLNISKHQIVFAKRGLQYNADMMVYSCIYDRHQPALWDKLRNHLGVPKTLSVDHSKALVVLITRDGCFKCGRNLTNQDQIMELLQNHYGTPFVKIFKGPLNLAETMKMFGKCRIIIGSHGGGLYNMVFTPPGATIIEFMPTTDSGETGMPGHQVFWKLSNDLTLSRTTKFQGDPI